jgi:predicted Zn-dependent protease with MMP-like domain
MSEREIEQTIEAAYAALAAGEPVEALRITEAIPEDHAERYILRAEGWIDLALEDKAEQELAEAADLLGKDDGEVRYMRGRLRVLQWRTAEARSELEGLQPEEYGAPLLALRALIEEIEGGFERADELYAQAAELEPELACLPPRLSADAFEERVAQAAAELPSPFREAFERTAVIIDPMPTRKLLDVANTGHPPHTLGVFVGAPLTDGEPVPGELPPTIFLFQRNLERYAEDEVRLIEEIRTTLYHELGHALGFDEDGVEDMGLA